MVATPRNSPFSLNPLFLGRAGRFLRADVNKSVYQFGALVNKLLFSRDDICRAK